MSDLITFADFIKDLGLLTFEAIAFSTQKYKFHSFQARRMNQRVNIELIIDRLTYLYHKPNTEVKANLSFS